jgi:nucleotide-binding universal stress UspA family protein
MFGPNVVVRDAGWREAPRGGEDALDRLRKADMIVAGQSGRSAIADRPSGSTSRRVPGHATSPALGVRAR